MANIANVHARQIFDSRGNPTVEVEITTDEGIMGRAAVPSGASTGEHEALELRDKEKAYLGKGVSQAVNNVNGSIAKVLEGMPVEDQRRIDDTLLEIDGTKNKAKLGANATLGVSLAAAKAASITTELPLYAYLGGANAHTLPVPMMNIINGGAHANNAIDIQEFMIMPIGADSIANALQMGGEIFHALKSLLAKDGYSTAVGDEGGFAPALNATTEALDYIMKAIETAGYKTGDEVAISLDAASSEFFQDGKYNLEGEGKQLIADELVAYYDSLIKDYPIISIEDAMDENDHEGWKSITDKMGDKIQLVGDDLFVTNPVILEDGIKKGLANALLVKPNQIGTLSETLDAMEMAHNAGYNCIVSHRSGETEDTTISHIAVATNCGQIKTGSMSRSDRMAKYNELLRIEERLGNAASYAGKNILS